MKFKVGDRVIIEEGSMYFHQNKDNLGRVYEGTITAILDSKVAAGRFNYSVRWDRGASSTSAYYRESDLIPAFFIPTNNIEAKQLLTKEW